MYTENYQDSVIQDALEMYLKGMKISAISRELKKIHPKISDSTIRKWSVKYDWANQRAKRVQAETNRIIESSLDEISQQKSTLALLINASISAAIDKEGNAIVQAKSLEGVSIAVDRLVNTYNKLVKEEKDKFSPIEFLKIIHEAIVEIPELNEAMNKPGVRDRFYRIIKAKNERRLTKEIDITP